MFGLLRLGELLRLQASSMASVALDKPGRGSLQHTASATRSKFAWGSEPAASAMRGTIKSGHLDRLESAMHAMQATEAKARSAGLLRKVERGQSVVGTRHGEAIANVIPARAGERADRKQRVARFRRRREEWQPFATSIDDILLARHQGHRC